MMQGATSDDRYPPHLREASDYRDRLCTERELHRLLRHTPGECPRCLEYLEVRRDEYDRVSVGRHPAEVIKSLPTAPGPSVAPHDDRVSRATTAGWWTRVTRSQEEVEASELATQVHSHGAQEIGACSRGQSVCIHGIIRSVTLRPRASAPSLEAEVYDGSGHITLVWIGHRRLSGVDVGRPITAHGRVTCPQGSPTIFNPAYELLPKPADVI